MNDNEIAYLKLLYYDLCRLIKYSGYHNSTLDSLMDEFDYLLSETSVNYITKKAVELFRKFYKSMEKYNSSVNYSDFNAIKFLDIDYINILKEQVMPLITEVEKSFELNNLQYDKCDLIITYPKNESVLHEFKYLLKNT